MIRTAALAPLVVCLLAGAPAAAHPPQPGAGPAPTAKAAPAAAALPKPIAPRKPTPVAAATPAAAALGAAAPARSSRYSRWIEDLPVMPGLTESPGGYSFEIFQGGRLAEARFTGAQDAGVVQAFYASTLGALGWRPSPAEPYAYRRGRERMILHVMAPSPALRTEVVFVLTPEGQPPPPAPVAHAPL
jgi:hypothetical protein